MTLRFVLWSIWLLTAVAMWISPVAQAEMVVQSYPAMADRLNPVKELVDGDDGCAITLGTALQQRPPRGSRQMSVPQTQPRHDRSITVNFDGGFEVMFSLADTGLPEDPVRQISRNIASGPLVDGLYQLITAPTRSHRNWKMVTGAFVASGALASVELLGSGVAINAYRPTLDNVAVNLTVDQARPVQTVGLGMTTDIPSALLPVGAIR